MHIFQNSHDCILLSSRGLAISRRNKPEYNEVIFHRFTPHSQIYWQDYKADGFATNPVRNDAVTLSSNWSVNIRWLQTALNLPVDLILEYYYAFLLNELWSQVYGCSNEPPKGRNCLQGKQTNKLHMSQWSFSLLHQDKKMDTVFTFRITIISRMIKTVWHVHSILSMIMILWNSAAAKMGSAPWRINWLWQSILLRVFSRTQKNQILEPSRTSRVIVFQATIRSWQLQTTSIHWGITYRSMQLIVMYAKYKRNRIVFKGVDPNFVNLIWSLNLSVHQNSFIRKIPSKWRMASSVAEKNIRKRQNIAASVFLLS